MKKILSFVIVVSLLFTLVACGGSDSGGSGDGAGGGNTRIDETGSENSRRNPAKVNEVLVFDSMDEENEAHRVELTLLEVLRGGAALKMAREADPWNEIPPEGKELLFAKFKVNILESKNDEPVDVGYMFDVVKGNGSVYDSAYTYISGVQSLATMYEGATEEGYVFFTVNKNDEETRIVFPSFRTSQIWFSGEPTAGGEYDDYNPYGDPNRVGSAKNPAGTGETANFNGMDLWDTSTAYNIDITVTEVNRGQRALDMVTLMDRDNDSPPKGREYLIAKIKIDAIDAKNDSTISISNYDISLYNSTGIQYTDNVYVYGMDEGFKSMFVGASQEVYVPFFVDEDDTEPFIVIHPDSEVPVWISVADSDTEPLIDQNALGSRRTPVPLSQAIECIVENYSSTFKLEMAIVDFARGLMDEKTQDELDLRISDLKPGMELIIIRVEVTALESKNDAKISIDEYDFELVSKDGIKYERVHTYGNNGAFTDMYEGANQIGLIFFQVDMEDGDPLVVYNESGSNNGIWFSLAEVGEPKSEAGEAETKDE